MKTLCYIFLMLFPFTNSLVAQNSYYYYKNEKRELHINTNYIYLALKEGNNKSSFDPVKYLEKNGVLSEIKTSGHQKFVQNYDWYIVHLKETIDWKMYNNIISILGKNEMIDAVEPVIGTERPTAISDIFYVKLKHPNDLAVLQEAAANYKFEIIKQAPYLSNWYYVKNTVHSLGSTLDVANKMTESNLFESIDPGFMLEFKPNTCTSTEPMFSDQWGLSNSLGGPDIRACDAWEITQGNINVRVAIIDLKVDVMHQEFSSNIVNSYDIISGLTIDPTVIHGTHVAGIIGANINNTQITGVAPFTGLMPIAHDLLPSSTLSAELATGIGWAVDNGADIINNSWGDQGGTYYADLQSALLDDAISDAMNNGRGGLGTLVVFGAGNMNDYGLDYPANSNPDILTAGSIQDDGQRSSFSAHGPELDVIAPGSHILSTIPSNGTYYLSGTSMAAPFVSGIAALLLSVNPCLTRQQLHDIICSSAQKITLGSYSPYTTHPLGTWGEYFGYGLVDAKGALDVAFHSRYLQNNVEIATTNYANYGSIYAGYNVDLVHPAGYYIISNTANIDIQSARSITFEPGFIANNGSIMTAHIVPPLAGCSQWPASYKTNEDLTKMLSPLEAKADVENRNILNIYPNPFKDGFQIDFGLTNKTSVNITVTDIEGRVVYNNNNEYDSGNHSLNIAINSSASIYFIKVCRGNSCEIKKMVKYGTY